MDFVADELFGGKSIRLLIVVDNFSRQCMAIHVGQHLGGQDVVHLLEQLRRHCQRTPKRIQVDNGSEFISKALDKWAYENQVTLDFSRPGKPTSFNGSLRDECLNTNWFLSLEDARDKIEQWWVDYNAYRLQSSLNNLAPNEFIRQHQNSQIFPIMAGTEFG